MLQVDAFVNLTKEARLFTSTRLGGGRSVATRRAALPALTYAISFASLTFLNLFPECDSAKTRLIPEPILRRVTLVVPRPNGLLFWDLRKTIRTLCFERRPSFRNSVVFQPLSPSLLSVDARSLRRVRLLVISLRAKRTLTKDEKTVFHKLENIFARAILFVETEFSRCQLSWSDVLFCFVFFSVVLVVNSCCRDLLRGCLRLHSGPFFSLFRNASQASPGSFGIM